MKRSVWEDFKKSAQSELPQNRSGEIRGAPVRYIAGQSRAERHMDALDTRAVGIAHDLRNLLTVIQGDASLVLLDTVIPITRG
jgi:signal transduction histidine kinase